MTAGAPAKMISNGSDNANGGALLGREDEVSLDGGNSVGSRINRRVTLTSFGSVNDLDACTGDFDNDDEIESGACCAPPSRCCYGVNMHTYQTTLLFMINTFLFADQNLMSPNLSQIALDFGLTPKQRDQYLGGYVSLAFFSVGALSSVIGGLAADSTNRLYGMAFVTLIGSVGCLGTFFVQNEDQFIVMRALTGVSIGGSVPFFFSLLGDLFPTNKRGMVTALAGVAMCFGVGFGQVVSGLVGPSLGWRVPFLMISMPTFFLVFLLVSTTSEPVRGRQERILQNAGVTEFEGFNYSERISWAKMGILLRSKSVVLLLLQGLPSSLPWGVILTYFNDFVAQEIGVTVEKSTLLVMVFGIGIMGGQLVAGWLTDRWLDTRTSTLVLLAVVCLIVGAGPLIAILYLGHTFPLWGLMLTCLPTGICCGVPGGMIKGLLINVSMPEVRGTAFALNNLVDDLGRGLGSFFVSLIIANVERRADALAVSFSGWAVAAIIILPLTCTYKNDLTIVEERIARNYLTQRPDHADFLADYELPEIADEYAEFYVDDIGFEDGLGGEPLQL